MGITKSKIQEWLDATDALIFHKKRESILRKEISEEVLAGKLKGVVHKEIHGFKVSPTAKLNQSLNKEELSANWSSLSEDEKSCIKFEPELIQKELDKLPEDSKLWQFITNKPGMPSLVIELVVE